MGKIKPLSWILVTVACLVKLTDFQDETFAQQLPPLYQNVPIELASAHSIAKFPVNTFLESIVVDADGTLLITSHEDGKIINLTPDGRKSIRATVKGKVAGLALTDEGDLLVTGWDENMTPTIFQISPQGTVKTLMKLPEAAFLNGITHLTGDRYLIADSYRGTIWELDASQGQAKIWLEHPLLARTTPESRMPGVNGLKIFSGVLYASNSDRAYLVRIPIIESSKPGKPEIFVNNAVVDDFAFDTRGNLYGATHVFNSVVKISPDGAISIIARDRQGVTGSTAVAFGRRVNDRTSLYVVTNGGMFLPPPTGIVPAEVVRLKIDIPSGSR